MTRRTVMNSLIMAAVLTVASLNTSDAQAAGRGQPQSWGRFYHYPYVYYPQNFQRVHPYDHLYYKYPQQMRIPVYNKNWYNFYPSKRPYHKGHHFILDVF